MVGAVVGAAAAVGSAVISSNAAKSAAKTQAAGSSAGTDDTLAMYNQSRADLAPYRNAGYAAQNQLSYLMGLPASSTDSQGMNDNANDTSTATATSPQTRQEIYQALLPTYTTYTSGGAPTGDHPQTNPDGSPWTPSISSIDYTGLNAAADTQFAAQNSAGTAGPTAANNGYGATVDPTSGNGYGSLSKSFTAADMQTDPGYLFRLQQGNQALNQAQAARGSFYSGAALKEADAYNSGQAAQQYNTAYDQYNTNQNNLYNKLAGISNQGFGATNAGVNSNTSTGNALASIANTAGNNAANASVAQGNIYSQGISGLLGGGNSSFGSSTGSTGSSSGGLFGSLGSLFGSGEDPLASLDPG